MEKKKTYNKTCARLRCDKGRGGTRKKYSTPYEFKKYCDRDCTVTAFWERKLERESAESRTTN